MFAGEIALRDAWYEKTSSLLTAMGYTVPAIDSVEPVFGGRFGKHTAHIQPLLEEMSEVFRIDPAADW